MRFYSGVRNVGDLLLPYIVSKVTGKKAFNLTSYSRPHLLGIGSVMHFATKNSIVWGTGIIDPLILPSKKTLSTLKVIGLRGELSKSILKEYNSNIEDIFLGDPGLIMPLIYQPSVAEKKYRVGIIPHYVDQTLDVVEKIKCDDSFLMIDVHSDPEDFINSINLCSFVVSSSLHGLILADAYGVPNCWVKFSDKLLGGEFKFKDYYSTTHCHNRDPIVINDYCQFELEDIISKCRVCEYKYDIDNIVAKLPISLE